MDLFSANQLMWAAFIVGNSAPLLFITLYKTQKISTFSHQSSIKSNIEAVVVI